MWEGLKKETGNVGERGAPCEEGDGEKVFTHSKKSEKHSKIRKKGARGTSAKLSQRRTGRRILLFL